MTRPTLPGNDSPAVEVINRSCHGLALYAHCTEYSLLAAELAYQRCEAGALRSEMLPFALGKDKTQNLATCWAWDVRLETRHRDLRETSARTVETG